MSVEVRAVAKYIPMSAQKVRLVADLVRGMSATRALDVLRFTPKAAAHEVRKCVQSAVANAEENYGLAADELIVSAISADEGPTLKRGRPGARGRYKPILKRSSHITVVVSAR
ncbi:MAG: 50S ribosomal protein L22 [Anaerolineae bacterium]|jgi:large subunit ribosomal protein L22|nr:50S ribosomal protein L22 [Chloroflexota bacterium]